MCRRLLFIGSVCLCLLSANRAHAEGIRFLIGALEPTPPHDDSYVVVFEDPDNIAYARYLIVQKGDVDWMVDTPMVSCQIEAGADGINRDHRAPGNPEWSWHVVGEPSFCQVTVELIDATPTYVEEHLDEWIEMTGGGPGATRGQLVTWGYTVVEELGPIPEPATMVLLFGGVIAFLLKRGARRGRELHRCAPRSVGA